MEERKIFLNSNKSVTAESAENFLNVRLFAKTRLLPYNDVSSKLSLYQVYSNERDACRKYRMIFTINPVCTNILFNTRTEVVRYEGSSACTLLVGDETETKGDAKNSSELTWKQAIRDTEYSHAKLFSNGIPYVYHCGWDIFNNHMLRADDFVYVSKENTKTSADFNTITDKIRNHDGSVVSEYLGSGAWGRMDEKTERHLYQMDGIKTMKEAYTDNLAVKDGWYGFTNTTNVNIPNIKVGDEWVTVNKVMNNNNACEFIDLYPDRSLFSFIPKRNKLRRRVEKNWDFCLTYPYAEDREMFNVVNKLPKELPESSGGCSVDIVEAKVVYTNIGSELVQFKTRLRHTLKADDCVWLYYGKDDTITKFPTKVKVVSIGTITGEEKTRYFSVKLSSIATKFGYAKKLSDKIIRLKNADGGVTNGSETAHFHYKKDSEGVECQYYFRKYKKLLNSKGENLDGEINKLAFGENIYGDRVAQLIFTDDIDVTDLRDNKGRELSELYLTLIKTNRGHEKWYGKSNYTDEDIEFSHCFGKVTSGIEMPWEEKDGLDDIDYNIRKLHNVNLKGIAAPYNKKSKAIWSDFLGSIPSVLEDDITESGFTEFYGDIVEFDPVNAKETEIEKVYHRFNTAQREDVSGKFADILYDRLDFDDYDKGVNAKCEEGFTVTKGYLNTGAQDGFVTEITADNEVILGNLNPEGYYYNPHYKVTLREEATSTSEASATGLSYTNPVSRTIVAGRDENGKLVKSQRITFTNPIKRTFVNGDTLCFYDKKTKKAQWFTVSASTAVDGEGTKVVCCGNDGAVDIAGLKNKEYLILKTDDGVANYATYIPTMKKFVWKKLREMSELPNDSELYDMPFANGRHYKQENVNFFLMRQDPRGEYRLWNPENDGVYNNLSYFRQGGYDRVVFDAINWLDGTLNNICY